MPNNLAKTVVNLFSKGFYFFAALSSIVGIVAVLFFNDTSGFALLTALIFFCVLLLSFTVYLIYILHKTLAVRNENEYDSISTSILLDAKDKNTLTYEVYKLIQAKRPILTDFKYEFKWSGSILPKISSDIQEVGTVADLKDPDRRDYAVLRFKKPLVYNQSHVIHFRAEMDDSDQQAQPFIATKIDRAVDVIHFRVILRYKPYDYDKPAIIERVRNHSDVRNFERIRSIAFDKDTKTYDFHLLDPEVNCMYRIAWEK